MDAETVVREMLAVWEAGDMAKVGEYMADDFTFSKPGIDPVGKADFLAQQGAVVKAIPDWRFNAKNFKAQGNKVMFTVRITGTHTATLNPILPAGMPAVPATNKKIALPEEPITVTVRGDKIASFEAAQVPGGGLPGVLAQIGVPATH